VVRPDDADADEEARVQPWRIKVRSPLIDGV